MKILKIHIIYRMINITILNIVSVKLVICIVSASPTAKNRLVDQIHNPGRSLLYFFVFRICYLSSLSIFFILATAESSLQATMGTNRIQVSQAKFCTLYQSVTQKFIHNIFSPNKFIINLFWILSILRQPWSYKDRSSLHSIPKKA